MPKKLTQSEDYLRRAINTANRRLDVLKDAYGKTSDTYLLNYDLYEDPMFSKFVRNGKLSQDLRRSLKSETEMEEYANILLEKVETLSQSYSVAESVIERYEGKPDTSKMTEAQKQKYKERKINLQKEISTATRNYFTTIKEFYEVEKFVDTNRNLLNEIGEGTYVDDADEFRMARINGDLNDGLISQARAMINRLEELRKIVDEKDKENAMKIKEMGKNSGNYGKDLGGR